MSSESRFFRAAGLIMVAMVASRILGYLRDVVIYAWFGQNRLTDAYNAAFSIPDFLYMLLVGGALSSAFIPTFAGYIARREEDEAWRVASTIFNLIMLLMVLGITLGLIFTPQLVHLLVPGFTPEYAALTVRLTRVMFIQAFFMALNGISMGILNSYNHFLAPAVGSVLYNLGIILLGVLLAPRFGVMGFSLGVVGGAMAQFAVQVPALLKRGFFYRPVLELSHPGVRRIGKLMLPVLIGLSVTQFNLFVNQNLASGLAAGTVAALRSGQRLMQLPIGIFAVAVAVAVFPTLTAQAARGEMDDFKRSLSLGVRAVLFLNLPAAVGLAVLREPIIRLLFEQGKFTPAATRATAYALLFYCLGLFAYASIQVLNRAFYALQDTRTPVLTGVFTMGLNILLNLVLVRFLDYGGLALAYSLAGLYNMGALLFALRKRVGALGGRVLAVSLGKSLLASAAMGVAASLVSAEVGNVVDLAGKGGQALQVGSAVLAGTVAYAGLALALRMEEARAVWQILGRRLHRPRGGAP